MHHDLVMTDLEVAALHVSPAVLVVGAGPVGEVVMSEPRHQRDGVVVVVGTVVVVSVWQGTVSGLVMVTVAMVVVRRVVVVVIVDRRDVERDVLYERFWLRELYGEAEREGCGGRGPHCWTGDRQIGAGTRSCYSPSYQHWTLTREVRGGSSS